MMYWPLVVGSSRVSETWWEVLLVQQAELGWGCDDVMLFPSFLGIRYTLISAHWSAKYWRTHLEQILADTSLRLFQSTSFAGIIPKTHIYQLSWTKENVLRLSLDKVPRTNSDSLTFTFLLEFALKIQQLFQGRERVLNGVEEIEMEHPQMNLYIKAGLSH